METEEIKNWIEHGNTSLGIELGSTNIKAVLIGKDYAPIVSGAFEWESTLENNNWTYALDEVWNGLQNVYREISNKIKNEYNITLKKIGIIGFSGMMHGYLPFDENGNQLTAFRTWRNTTTEQSAAELSKLFEFNIPQRWSIAHLYQAMLKNEDHVKDIDFITTLAGYVHWQLTDEKVLGIGEAAGMFPIDSEVKSYNKRMLNQFENHISDYRFNWKLKEILPEILLAGENAGILTDSGAKLLDPYGELEQGIPLTPPEGDAGTGMVATNSVSARTGNVSAGTSIFSMVVLEKELSNYYTEIDMVTTPAGIPVAMIHCNNFTSDINDWISVFEEFIISLGIDIDTNELFTTFFNKAMEADNDNGNLMNFNYYTGEPITGFEEGRPLFVRMPNSNFNLSNFARTLIYSSLATLKIGMEILTEKENVSVDVIVGHGGFFKTKDVGQQIVADALKTSVSLMETAGEGGPWGMALLGAYALNNPKKQTLEDFLKTQVFVKESMDTTSPSITGQENFDVFIERYKKTLDIERAAVKNLK